jgi:uncharacterized repeat protein (TIGR01451 family)
MAWHPKGVIVKKVQNVTTNSVVADANDAAQALAAKPGDTLKYVIEVRNDGDTTNDNGNDMAGTKLTDTLPAGVELAGDAGKRTIEEDLGTIKPGQKVVKEYTVKVTSTENGALIDNKACFTGDSAVKDNPQQGCDTAKVKVSVPETPKPTTPAPTTPAPKAETPAPAAPGKGEEALPQTGAESLGALAGTSVFGYAAHAYVRSKQGVARALRLKK